MKTSSARVASGLLVFGLVFGWLACLDAPVLGAEEATPRQAAKVDPKSLDAYVGQYELAPKVILTLRRFRDRLTAQVSGQPPFAVYAANETTFFWKIVDAQFTIQTDKDGKVTGLFFEQGPAKLKAKRLSDKPPAPVDLPEPNEAVESPRIAALAKELQSGKKAALEQFWKDLRDKAPLVEPIPGDARHAWVTFVWRGDAKTRRVHVQGGPPTRDETQLLTRLADTDLWYRTERVPIDARFVYSFLVNRPLKVGDDIASLTKLMEQCPLQPDPLNPHLVCIQSMLNSLAELPGARPQPWLERQSSVPPGTLHEHTIKRTTLKGERAVQVYTTARVDLQQEPCELLGLLDRVIYPD